MNWYWIQTGVGPAALLQLAGASGNKAFARRVFDDVLRDYGGHWAASAYLDRLARQAGVEPPRPAGKPPQDANDGSEFLRLLAQPTQAGGHTMALYELLACAPPRPDARAARAAKPGSDQALFLAAVEAIQWRLPEGRRALADALPARMSSRRRGGQGVESMLVEALGICGGRDEAAAMLDAADKLTDRDDWELRQLKGAMLSAASALAPRLVAERMKTAAPMDARIMLADDAGEANVRLVAVRDDPMMYTGRGQASASILQSLIEARAAGAPAGGPGADPRRRALWPPWGASAGDTWPDVRPADAQAMLNETLQRLRAPGGRQGDDHDDIGPDMPWRMRRFGRGIYSPHMYARARGNGFDTEAAYFAGVEAQGSPDWLSAVHLPAKTLADALRPLLGDGQAGVRTGAMRQAARWRVKSLTDDLAARLADPNDRLEAAWALASLLGPPAAERLAALLAGETDTLRRVRLAGLLHVLGSQAGREHLERAAALTTARRMRLKLICACNDRGGDEWGLRAVLLPWEAGLSIVAGDLLSDGTVPAATPWEADEEDIEPPPPPEAAPGDLSALCIGQFGLLAPGPGAIDLPGPALVVQNLFPRGYYDNATPVFARLCAAEQALEGRYAVQFADKAGNLAELRQRWLAWWAASAARGELQWRLRGARQAAAELADGRWWHRQRGARRLTRLTGRAVVPPALFDMDAWRALSERWSRWLDQPGNADVRAWLPAAAAEAGLLEQSAAADALEGPGRLRLLVRLAGFAAAPLAEAALRELRCLADRQQLLRACLPWQDCPRRDLAAWAQAALRELTGKTRLVYLPSDLPAPSTRPAAGRAAPVR